MYVCEASCIYIVYYTVFTCEVCHVPCVVHAGVHVVHMNYSYMYVKLHVCMYDVHLFDDLMSSI